MSHDLPRTIGFWRASGVMVGIIVGSGIFRTPVDIAAQIASPWLILALWAAGGLLSLAGAFTYAEMATMYPQSGGVYVFLREAYGRGMAFVFGWTYLLISKPYAAAAIAFIFGEHVNRLLGVNWDARITTIVVLTVCTLINVLGMRLGSTVAFALTTIKAGALGMIVALGLALLPGSARTLSASSGGQTVSILAALVPVMYGVLWTYDGWSDVGAIAGEVKDPQRQLPRIYLAGTAAITLVYVAVNAVYMLYVPLDEMRAPEMQQSGTVAPVVVARLFEGLGLSAAAGGVALTLIVLISTLGSTHGSIITGARISYAQARDRLLFGFLGRVHPRFRTPHVSLWVQLALSSAACLIAGNFQSLVGGFMFTMWIFYGLAGAGIFILRVKRPCAERPYRCWGYPFVPALFILAALGMTVLSMLGDWKQTLPWVGVLLLGAPVYQAWKRFAPAHRDGQQ